MHEIQYGHELHAFLDGVPTALRGGRLEELRSRCEQLIQTAPQERVQRSLSELHKALDGRSFDGGKGRRHIMKRYEEAMRAYEQWLQSWREDPTAPHSLAPLIAMRTVFHAGMACVAVGMYQFVLTKTQALVVLYSLFGLFLTLELTRRFSKTWNDVLVTKIFGLISRPRELHKTNSATYYLLALCFITTLFSREAVIAGILVLGFGDPAAAWIGKRFGKKKIYGKKSWAGSIAFFVTSVLVAGGFLFAVGAPAAVGMRVLGVVAAAFAGAVAELYTTKLDDNLTVPVAAGIAAALFI